MPTAPNPVSCMVSLASKAKAKGLVLKQNTKTSTSQDKAEGLPITENTNAPSAMPETGATRNDNNASANPSFASQATAQGISGAKETNKAVSHNGAEGSSLDRARKNRARKRRAKTNRARGLNAVDECHDPGC
mmetsp:Transcript_57288/g.121578  ORF Transcript_57288/g.121578 Transcript_57288/m.121578 type:complete len:133 (+) Transcript_57288:98-496(+)|eukprot:CAMPEP_0172551264 /NCGR_PEP_ID=MMETSP1067-20121228/37285_1 /TAXON_ID=265564 ORGANISM="Thalassiosira punctigera, Strain Tpunct2005C2" /NCGR_SAMPLE_ID=MMETSP1067 /ASSEMBLY_ACC=CAM_ASM_000444 /LENGTH=132 /DNA_ID=CAMNT_0013339029 /DNA_START=85 /DNA_END=483 /DNA_ORIENTATION=+